MDDRRDKPSGADQRGVGGRAWVGLFSRRGVRVGVAVGVLVLGALGSEWLHRMVENSERAAIEVSFNRDAQARVHAVAERVEAWMVAVRSLSAFYASSQEVERSEFEEYVRPILTACAGVRTIEWLPRVKRSQREEHEFWPWAGKPEGYRMLERNDAGAMVFAGDRDEYFPAAFVEPAGRAGAAVGFDHGSDPVRLAAMQEARDRGEVVSTAVTDLSMSGPPRRGILVLAPVYKNRTTGKSVEERRANLQGFVLASFVVDEVVERVMSDLPQPEIGVYLFDDTAAGDDQLLYASSTVRRVVGKSAGEVRRQVSGSMIAEMRIDLPGRSWRALCLPTEEFIEARSSLGPKLVLTGGLAITALIGGWLWAMARQTAEVTSANARLEEEIAERRRTAEQLMRYQESLRSLASELSMAEERERRRIAIGLHDDLGQPLALAKIKLGQAVEAASSLAGAAATDGRAEGGGGTNGQGEAGQVTSLMTEVRTLLDQVVAATRSMTFELGSPILYELGLESALESLVERHEQRHGVEGVFEDDGRPKPVAQDVQIVLFQAVRELLFNSAKHARAAQVKVSAEREGERIVVTVEDDGVGFDSSLAGPSGEDGGGYGLFNVRERLTHFGGSMTIDSRPGEGTKVRLEAPLSKQNPRETQDVEF